MLRRSPVPGPSASLATLWVGSSSEVEALHHRLYFSALTLDSEISEGLQEVGQVNGSCLISHACGVPGFCSHPFTRTLTAHLEGNHESIRHMRKQAQSALDCGVSRKGLGTLVRKSVISALQRLLPLSAGSSVAEAGEVRLCECSGENVMENKVLF